MDASGGGGHGKSLVEGWKMLWWLTGVATLHKWGFKVPSTGFLRFFFIWWVQCCSCHKGVRRQISRSDMET